ncbi:pilus assembly protein PilM [Candidatus Saccharibacteria bacterium]|nr:pilus assembly protein PilM [Candidatus Saccharibacteria bacterium]MCL1963279.1 pilus assembly protein PilM [Candidatus Saccharibacteria bacterium]
MMFNKVGSFFALDIGTTAVRVVELAHSGHGWDLKRYGSQPIDTKTSESSSEQDKKVLGEAIISVMNQAGIKTKDVAIGIPSQRMFASVIEVPNVSKAELNATIKYQAENYVPMKIDEAKIDWAVIGTSPNDPQKAEVLIASVLNQFTESRMDLLEGIGLNIVAIEPDSLALTRALLPDGVQDGRLILDIGDNATDLVMTIGTAPRLVRSIPIGFSSLVRASKQNLNIDPQQAQQLILKFGVGQDKLEGQLFRAINATLEQLMAEIQKSLKFFATKYANVGVGAILASGYAAVIPDLLNMVSQRTGVTGQIATPWQHVNVPVTDQAQIAPISSQFAVVVGLAERLGF